MNSRAQYSPAMLQRPVVELVVASGKFIQRSRDRSGPRTTTREVMIQDRTIPKGVHLALMWIAANRDARAFDDPNVVKIERSTDASLVWGQGIHLCQGAPLARL